MAFIFGNIKKILRARAMARRVNIAENNQSLPNQETTEDLLCLQEAKMGKDMHDAIMTDNIENCLSILRLNNFQVNNYLKFVGRYSSDDRRTCISELQGGALH